MQQIITEAEVAEASIYHPKYDHKGPEFTLIIPGLPLFRVGYSFDGSPVIKSITTYGNSYVNHGNYIFDEGAAAAVNTVLEGIER